MSNIQTVENIYGGEVIKPQRGAAADMVVNRQAQEVQAAMVVAKRFPRDEIEAYNRIIEACKRKTLAEVAFYEYIRGGQKITGPSIRLAEVLAQNWGNIDFGVIELDQLYGKSQMMAFAWDLETNTRQSKVFTVPHTRKTKARGTVELDDPRDIYETVANMGARRMRACILGVIPGDVIESAARQCMETLKGASSQPLKDRVRNMAQKFSSEFSVTMEMLEEYIGCNHTAFTEMDILRMSRVYNSLRDGMAAREDYFKIATTAEATEPEPAEQEAPPEAPAEGETAVEEVNIDEL